MKPLGTLDELPRDYVAALAGASVVPLWPSMRALLPPQAPRTSALPAHWRRGAIGRCARANSRRWKRRSGGCSCWPTRVAGSTACLRRSAIYLGMQLVLPGETTPGHRHTPNDARIVVEGKGAVTVVDGEPCAMEPGDLILTPPADGTSIVTRDETRS